MYSTVKKLVTALIAALLVFLFTVPSVYLVRTTDELLLQTAAACRAMEQGEDPGPHLTEMARIMDGSAPALRLFLDHNLVDETLMAVHALRPMTDPEHLRSDLESIRVQFDRLRDAEVFRLRSIL